MVDITKTLEVENGIISNDVVLLDSLIEASSSNKLTYSSDLISSIDFYNSLTQINANRIITATVTYSSESITQEVWTVYRSDGTTVDRTITIDYTYTGDNITSSEVVEV